MQRSRVEYGALPIVRPVPCDLLEEIQAMSPAQQFDSINRAEQNFGATYRALSASLFERIRSLVFLPDDQFHNTSASVSQQFTVPSLPTNASTVSFHALVSNGRSVYVDGPPLSGKTMFAQLALRVLGMFGKRALIINPVANEALRTGSHSLENAFGIDSAVLYQLRQTRTTVERLPRNILPQQCHGGVGEIWYHHFSKSPTGKQALVVQKLGKYDALIIDDVHHLSENLFTYVMRLWEWAHRDHLSQRDKPSQVIACGDFGDVSLVDFERNRPAFRSSRWKFQWHVALPIPDDWDVSAKERYMCAKLGDEGLRVISETSLQPPLHLGIAFWFSRRQPDPVASWANVPDECPVPLVSCHSQRVGAVQSHCFRAANSAGPEQLNEHGNQAYTYSCTSQGGQALTYCSRVPVVGTAIISLRQGDLFVTSSEIADTNRHISIPMYSIVKLVRFSEVNLPVADFSRLPVVAKVDEAWDSLVLSPQQICAAPREYSIHDSAKDARVSVRQVPLMYGACLLVHEIKGARWRFPSGVCADVCTEYIPPVQVDGGSERTEQPAKIQSILYSAYFRSEAVEKVTPTKLYTNLTLPARSQVRVVSSDITGWYTQLFSARKPLRTNIGEYIDRWSGVTATPVNDDVFVLKAE